MSLLRDAEKYRTVHVRIVVIDMLKSLLCDYDLHQNKTFFNEGDKYSSGTLLLGGSQKNLRSEFDRSMAFWYLRGRKSFRRLTTKILQVHFRETWKNIYKDECHQVFSDLVPEITSNKLIHSILPQEEGTPFPIAPFASAYPLQVGDFVVYFEFKDGCPIPIRHFGKERRVYPKDHYNESVQESFRNSFEFRNWFEIEAGIHGRKYEDALKDVINVFFTYIYQLPQPIIGMISTY